MAQSPATVNHTARHLPTPTTLRFDWLRASLASGFIATFAMTTCLAIAFGFADATGDANGNTFERWLAALSSNELTDNVGSSFAVWMVINLAVGLIWAMIYARWAEPMLTGPGWRRGALFSLLPWLLSILVFFPVAGVGLFGSELDAGPLPVIGNLILHLVFGITLGALYAIEAGSGIGKAPHDLQANTNGERGASLGLIIGAVVGLIGGWIVGPSMSDLGSEAVIAFAGALSGAAFGMLIGSFLGLKVDDLG